MHPRQAIRDYLADLLAGAGTLAGSNVFNSRVYASEAPIHIRIYSPEDSFDRYIDMGQRKMDRILTLVIECIVHHVTTPEEKLDDLCREVENAIEDDFLFGSAGSELLILNQYEGTVIEPMDQDAQKKTFMGRITYRATYQDILAA